MNLLEKFDAFAIDHNLRHWEGLYTKTGNPLFAWECYRFCRQEEIDCPAWVFEYLDRCADGLLSIELRSGQRIAGRVARAVEFSTAMGGPSVFEQHRTALRKRGAITCIEALRSRGRDPAASLANIDQGLKEGKLTPVQARRWKKYITEVNERKTDAEIFEIAAEYVSDENTIIDTKTVMNWWYEATSS